MLQFYYIFQKHFLICYRGEKMSVSEAQKRATLKWQKEKTDEVRFRVPKGERARIQAHAEQHGESATAFIKRAIREAMERDNAAK